MSVSHLTSKGQTTIPKRVREHLHLSPGDKIDFVIESDGRVVLKPATIDVGELEGILHRPGAPAVTLEEMGAAVRKRFTRTHRP